MTPPVTRPSDPPREPSVRSSDWAVALLAGLLVVLVGAPASAHPLGLPAFARIAATADDEVTVVWNAAPDDVAALARSLAMAPVSQDLLTADEDAELSASPRLHDALNDGIQVRQDASTCPASVEVESLVTRGATLRFRCPQPVDRVTIDITLLTDLDERYRTLALVGTTAGEERWMFTATGPERTFELDPDLAGAVLGGEAGAVGADGAEGLTFGGSLPLEGRFVTLIDTVPTPATIAFGLLLALGIGALHGLAPGHGKAIAAAYLVGDRGRPRDAVLLGGVVALMHTGSVLLLGTLLYRATPRPDTVELSAALQVVSGVLVAALGGWVLRRRWRAAGHRAAHTADHVHHQHPGHGHGHDHAPALPEDVSPLSWPGLVVLGAAGGLLPSPSAMLVLFTSLAVGRLAYGLSLIAAFSVGLAATVAAVGLAAVWGRDLVVGEVDRPWVRRLVRWAPVVAAAGVTLLGVVLVARGLAGLG